MTKGFGVGSRMGQGYLKCCNDLCKWEWEWTWQNPTGDDWVSSTHKRRNGAKVVSSMTALAHQFPPPLSSGCESGQRGKTGHMRFLGVEDNF